MSADEHDPLTTANPNRCGVWVMQSQTDLGFLMSPGDGAVTALRFHAPAGKANPSHMLSGSADGSVCIWRAGGDWGCLKKMDGHK